jgi:hypothetical protein
MSHSPLNLPQSLPPCIFGLWTPYASCAINRANATLSVQRMANQPHKFKNRDITRCLKAASAAGVSSPTVEVHLLPGGTTKYVVGGEVMPKEKKSEQRPATYSKGGKDRMFKEQAAGPDRPGNTGKDQTAAPGSKRASGGGAQRATAGLAFRALPGQTGTDRVEDQRKKR